MTKLFKLAWRNVWRNRRRSLITMSAIIFALLIISAAGSIQNGTYDLMEGFAVRLYSGDVQIHQRGFHDEQTLNYALRTDVIAWDSLLAAQPWVDAYSRRITGFGLISSDSASAGGMIVGIEPAREHAVSTFARAPVSGLPLSDDDDHSVLLGQTLANNLLVQVGDTVVVLTQGFRNEMGADLYAVKGLVRTGSVEIDRAMMIMPLGDAQFLFSMPNRVTAIVVRGRDFRRSDSYEAALRRTVDSEDYEVMRWEQLMPELKQARALDDGGNNIFYAFLLILVGFEIFNTASMSVMERIREFGIMQSIGMRPGQISALVALELCVKIVLATVAGMLIVFVLSVIFGGTTIPLSADLRDAYQSWGFNVEGISFSTRPIVFLQPVISVLSVAILSTIYPILKVRRFSPVQALRYV